MYLKTKNRSVIIFLILVVVFTGISLEAKNYHHGASFDEIVANIKNSEDHYEWNESIVTFEHKGMNLVCTLTVPETNRKCPIVITLNGFTGNRNDLVIPGTDEPFFQRASRILAENGYASLRLDFRGSGDSDGEYSMTSFSSQISDTIAAIDFIEDNLRQVVNTKKIGIIGFSQGGLVASVTASRDKRVDSVVLWSPPANPVFCYEGLLTRQGILDALKLEDGSIATVGLYIDGVYILDMQLGKQFFVDLFGIDPVAEIKSYKKPLMVVVGKADTVVYPQPAQGQLFMKYHNGYEKLIIEDGGHNFNFADGAEGPDAVFYKSTAWFLKTLKTK